MIFFDGDVTIRIYLPSPLCHFLSLISRTSSPTPVTSFLNSLLMNQLIFPGA